jgi:hypothetical protein
MQIVSSLGKPKAGAQPQSIPAGSAFRLPDGRVVPAETCAQFVARYRQLHGVDPSLEVCVAAFTDLLNAQGAQAQPAIAQPPVTTAQPQPQLVGSLTRDQAEAFVLDAQHRAAAEATRAGLPPDKVKEAIHAAQQQAIAQLRSGTAPQPPVGAAAQPATPQPAPAAVAAMQAANAAQQPVAAQVQAGPVPAEGSVVIPWMHRGFLRQAIDAFTTRQDPISFLDHSLRTGSISTDAKLVIGRIYEDSGDDESIQVVLQKVAALLSERGVELPADFISAFRSDPEGVAWLDAFLFACSCGSIEEARKGLTEG